MKKMNLVGMCKTRWVERHSDTFCEIFLHICECLEAILDPLSNSNIYTSWPGEWDPESRTKAQGLLASLVSFQTIIAFIIVKKYLKNVRAMASKLQKLDLDIF